MKPNRSHRVFFFFSVFACSCFIATLPSPSKVRFSVPYICSSQLRVLVGAPLDNATSSGGSGANAVLEKFGAVYDCPFDEKKRTSAKCRPLNIDNKRT